MGAVAKRYAKALFQVARERDQLDLVSDELNTLVSLMQKEAQLDRFLYHPLVKKEAKLALVREVFNNQLSETVDGLMRLLIERDRHRELGEIARYYTDLVHEERNMVEAVVTTATPLSSEQEEQLRAALAALTAHQVNLVPVVKPEILGGISVKIGDTIYDGSVQGKLNRFERKLMTTKS